MKLLQSFCPFQFEAVQNSLYGVELRECAKWSQRIEGVADVWGCSTDVESSQEERRFFLFCVCEIMEEVPSDEL